MSYFDFGDDDDAVEQLAVQNDRLVKVGQLIDCSSGFCLCPTKCTPLGDTDHCDDNDDQDERNYNNYHCYNDNAPTKNKKIIRQRESAPGATLQLLYMLKSYICWPVLLLIGMY